MFHAQPISLQRGALRLDPLTESDVLELVALAEDNRDVLHYLDGPLRPDWYRQALAEARAAQALPFAIRLADRLVGTTRFAGFLPTLPAAELGWTWLVRDQHGTGLNATLKYLLLRYAFEQWRLVRVQLRTAASDPRAQRALERLGAVQEGRLRHHRRLADGRLDDTLLYSITDEEWPGVKRRLEERFG